MRILLAFLSLLIISSPVFAECDGDATAGAGETAYNLEDTIYYDWVTTASVGTDTVLQLTHVNVICREVAGLTYKTKCAVYNRGGTGRLNAVVAFSPEIDLINSSFASIKFDMTDTVEIDGNTEYAIAIWAEDVGHPSRRQETATYTNTNDTVYSIPLTYGSWPTEPNANNTPDVRLGVELCYNRTYSPLITNNPTIPAGKIPETHWEAIKP